jgi:hypothetical protein
MIRPFRVFLPTEMSTECDACGVRFDLVKGGACQRCRRVLCPLHLHGSWTRRLLVDLGAASVCSQCRAGLAPRSAGATGSESGHS